MARQSSVECTLPFKCAPGAGGTVNAVNDDAKPKGSSTLKSSDLSDSGTRAVCGTV